MAEIPGSRIILAGALILCSVIRSFAIQGYSAYAIGTPRGIPVEAVDLTESGMVVVNEYESAGQYEKRLWHYPFLWDNGTSINIGTLGGGWAEAVAVSEDGTVIGNSANRAGDMRAFSWQDGVMEDLGTLGGRFSEAVGISPSGWVIGNSTNENGIWHAVVWKEGSMIKLAPGDLESSEAFLINDENRVLFSVFRDGEEEFFLWDNEDIVSIQYNSLDYTGPMQTHFQVFRIETPEDFEAVYSSIEIFEPFFSFPIERPLISWSIQFPSCGYPEDINRSGEVLISRVSSPYMFYNDCTISLCSPLMEPDKGLLPSLCGSCSVVTDSGVCASLWNSQLYVRNIDGSLFQYELNFPCSSFHIKKSIDDKLWISLYSEENRGSKLWVWDGDLIELGTCSDVEIIGLNNYFDYCGNMIQKPGGLKRAVFIRDGDSPVFIDPADAVESYVVGINNNRQVVGNYIVTPSPQAFAWKAGVWNSIGTLGGGWSKAILTNESDAVAGISQTSDGEEHAFIWSENRIQDIGTLGGSWSRPEIIDSRGAVFGVSETADGRTARFLYRNNQIHEITGDSETDHLMFEYGENDMGGWDSLSFNESPPGLGENVVIGYYAARMDSYTEARYPPYTPFAKVENKTIYLDIPPGYRWAYPQYVNQVGQIVGKSSPPEYLPLLRQSDSCRSGIFPMPPYYPYQEGQPVFWNPCPEIERLNGREDGSMELRLNIWPLFQGSSYVLEESPTPLGPWITWEIFSDIDRVSSFSVQMKPEEDRFITSGFYRVREILHP